MWLEKWKNIIMDIKNRKIFFNFYRDKELASVKSWYLIRSDLVVWNYCDKNCIFCNEWWLAANNILNKSDINKNIKLLKDEKTDWVTLWHREPTYSPYFKDNIKICKDNGVKTISVISAWYRFDDIKFCEDVLKLWLNEIRFSIHWHTAKLHDSITQKDWSFDILIKWLSNLSFLSHKYKFDIFIMVVICKQNKDYILDIYKFLRDFWIARIWFSFVEIKWNVLMSKYNIVPKFTEVLPNLISLFDYVDKLKLHDNESLNIENIPYCILPYKYHKYVWYRSIKIWNENKKVDIIDQFRDKEYIDKCKNCFYNWFCEWIHKWYIDLYWDDEINSVIKVKNIISINYALTNKWWILVNDIINLVYIYDILKIKKIIIYLSKKWYKKFALNSLFFKNKGLLFLKNKYTLEYYNIFYK